MAFLLWILAVAIVLAIGCIIGDHIIPTIIKAIKGKPQPKQRYDYAEKAWMKALTSYKH